MHPLVTETQKSFENTLHFLKKEFASLQAGRANSALVEDIIVESYGQKTPLKHVANISIHQQEILIDPWDKGQLSAVEKALRDAPELGLNPNNTGSVIRIVVPPLTEERRKEIVKVVHQKAENARVAIRQERHSAHDVFKKEEKNGDSTEDDLKRNEKDLQKKVDEVNKSIEILTKHKEEEVMKV